MIELARPLGALALIALLVPLVIHLLRRSAAREIPFAALDWLMAHTPPRRRFRLDQRLLLAVRLLLIALLAALLAEPLWRADGDRETARVYVAPGIDPARARATIGALPADGYWLATGLPSLAQPAPQPESSARLISLIRALDAELPSTVRLTLIVPELLGGLDGERLQLGRDVDWRIVADATVTPATPAVPPQPLRVAIRVDGTAQMVARALLAAWRADGLVLAVDEAADGVPVPEGTSMLIAGTAIDTALSARIADGLTLLRGDAADQVGEVLLRDDLGQPLLRRQRVGRGQIVTLAGALDPAQLPALRDPQLPQRLLPWLRPALPTPDRALAASVAPLRGAADAKPRAVPLLPWLTPLIAALALLERVLATRSAREPQ